VWTSQYEHFLTSHGVTSTFITEEMKSLQRRCTAIEEKLQNHDQRVSKRKRELDVEEEQRRAEKQTRVDEEKAAQEEVRAAELEFEKAKAVMLRAKETAQARKQARIKASKLARRVTKEREFLEAGPGAVASEKLRTKLDKVRVERKFLMLFFVFVPADTCHSKKKGESNLSNADRIEAVHRNSP
jgi:hypothetical protein